MKRILLAATTVLLTAAIVVASTLGATPRTVHMAALDAIKKGDYEMAVSHLKRSDHPDAPTLLSYMYYVPYKIATVTTGPDGELTSNESYAYNLMGNLVKSENTAADGTFTVLRYTYNDWGKIVTETSETQTALELEEEELEEELPEGEETGEADNFTGSEVEYFYDEVGNLLCKRTTDSTGLFYQYRYTYDSIGRVVSEVYVDGDAKWSRKEYTYDGETDRLTEKFTDYAGDWKNVVYTYADGVCRTEIEETAGGRCETIYNENGDLLTRTFHAVDHAVEKTVFTYDANGNCIRREYPSGLVYTYAYNEAGSLTEMVKTEEGAVVESTRRTYDEENRLVSEVVTLGEQEQTTNYTYNKKGFLVKKEHVAFDGNWINTEYEYERYDNLETMTETTAEGTTVTTIQWKVRYYPEGMPENVRTVYELYDVDKPDEV